jgi:type IV secretory pathway TraG/TraD family ATPase VirD4
MDNITIIGKTNFRNTNQIFGIKDKDRTGHIYCIGKTGVGKSTLLLNMAIDDINSGKGIGIIDPHGDLSESILDYIPNERIKDVIYFNGCDTSYPIAFNPLYNIIPEERHLVASNIVSTLKRIWAESWGPRLEHIFRNTILSLLHYSNATLLDIQPLLTDSEFRNEVLHHIKDSALLNFWYKEFIPMSPQMKNEAISPIINKIGLFQTHPLIRNIVGQPKSSFSIADTMNEKKIFIANLSKGSLGEDGTQLLGSMLVTQFQTAALARAKQSSYFRSPFYLYIDEMHSFVTLSFADILAESRKYGLCLFLTHQYIDQLNEKILAAILGNIGTLICFRIGASDATVLEQEFFPVFNSEDLVNLPQYHIYLKLLIDGTASRPFSATTLPLPKRNHSCKQEIIDLSRSTYARERKIVETEIKSKHYILKTHTTLFEM